MNISKSPWSWVPSLYFAEGLPNVAVMAISVIMYKQMGLSNAEITFYTSWLYLPWMLKPLWSPFVDLVKTKRWWIITMQLLVGAAFGGVVLLLTVLFQATGKIIPSFLLSISRQGVVFLLALVVCVHLFQYQGVLMAQAVADILSAALALGLLAASRDIIAKQ